MQKFTSFFDVPDYKKLLQKALEIKQNPFDFQMFGKNKTIGLLFLNPSLRTRLSSVKAAYNLGANVWVLNAGADSWQLEMSDGTIMDGNSQEHIKEAIQVMNQYCDILGVRTFPCLTDKQKDYSEEVMNKILQNCTKPYISLESATLHPLQTFADLITIEEHKTKPKPKVVLTWAPHPKALPQAVPNSFAEWFSNINEVDFVITHPIGYELDIKFTQNTPIIYDQNEALQNADFVYAKNWSSYSEYGKILSQDKSWIIDKNKMQHTDNGKFMHCLPVRRNVIVTDEVLDSENSLVIHQANNRTFSAQTIFHEMLK